jgi:hypothetical protein
VFDIPEDMWWVNDTVGNHPSAKTNRATVNRAHILGIPLFRADGSRRLRSDVERDIKLARMGELESRTLPESWQLVD